jgi:UEV domain
LHKVNLNGTIPVEYRGSTYNIPVCFWLLHDYPSSAPMAFVKPTQVRIFWPIFSPSLCLRKSNSKLLVWTAELLQNDYAYRVAPVCTWKKSLWTLATNYWCKLAYFSDYWESNKDFRQAVRASRNPLIKYIGLIIILYYYGFLNLKKLKTVIKSKGESRTHAWNFITELLV